MKKRSQRLRRQNRILILSLAFSVIALVFAFMLTPNHKAARSILGNDISYPQCHDKLPTDHAFGIIGVNGGVASKVNPCLATQLKWATKSSGVVAGQPKVQLYLNTGNPGEHNLPIWPHHNKDPHGHHTKNPYGDCKGDNSLSCAWQYGWNQTVLDVTERLPSAAKQAHIATDANAYIWWLDVETKNSWQLDDADGLARNRASLEGMVAFLQANHLRTGVYSTTYQWHKIMGDVPSKSNLNKLPSWIAGANDIDDAKSKCTSTPLTPGSKIVLVQFVAGKFDYNYACDKS